MRSVIRATANREKEKKKKSPPPPPTTKTAAAASILIYGRIDMNVNIHWDKLNNDFLFQSRSPPPPAAQKCLAGDTRHPRWLFAFGWRKNERRKKERKKKKLSDVEVKGNAIRWCRYSYYYYYYSIAWNEWTRAKCCNMLHMLLVGCAYFFLLSVCCVRYLICANFMIHMERQRRCVYHSHTRTCTTEWISIVFVCRHSNQWHHAKMKWK